MYPSGDAVRFVTLFDELLKLNSLGDSMICFFFSVVTFYRFSRFHFFPNELFISLFDCWVDLIIVSGTEEKYRNRIRNFVCFSIESYFIFSSRSEIALLALHLNMKTFFSKEFWVYYLNFHELFVGYIYMERSLRIILS